MCFGITATYCVYGNYRFFNALLGEDDGLSPMAVAMQSVLSIVYNAYLPFSMLVFSTKEDQLIQLFNEMYRNRKYHSCTSTAGYNFRN